MLELRSSQSLTGRINRNMAAETVDTANKTCVGSGVITTVSVIAVEMVTSDLKLLSIICAAVAAKDADIQRYETSGQERVTGNRLLPRFSSPHRSLLEYGTHVEGDFLA